MLRLAAVFVVLGSAAVAGAQEVSWETVETTEPANPDAPPTDLRPVQLRPFRGAFTLENGFYTQAPGGLRAIVYSPLLGVAFRPTERLELSARMGLVGVVLRDEVGRSTWEPGNLELAAKWVGELGRYPALWEIGTGGAVAAPIARTDGGAERVTLRTGPGIRALRDTWLWAEDAAALMGLFFLQSLSRVHFRVQTEMAFSIPARDSGDFAISMQLLLEGGYRVVPELVIGGGYSQVIFLGYLDDFAQSALTAFARADLDGFLLGGQLWLNLDDPYGLAFDDDGFWGLMVTLGVGLR